MSSDRYVVVGLAPVRATWFSEVSRWSTTGSLPIEFVKCVSVQELRSRVTGGRLFSAALLDGRLPGVDRDLLATLDACRVPSLVISPSPGYRDWSSLGAIDVLAEPLDRARLLSALRDHCRMVGGIDARVPAPPPAATVAPWRGHLVAVTGSPGTGRSTLAAALAQGLADDARSAGDVVLVDLARRAHQAVLHDAMDVVPGIQEIVEAHRIGRVATDDLRQLSFDVPSRGYRLVLGLRRPEDWITIRSRAFGTALEAIQHSARAVVADCDPDLEGEAETGSLDIEDLHLMARATITRADVVLVVSTPTTTGIHGLVSTLADLRAHRVPGERTIAVINRAPKAARARAELTRALANLTGSKERAEGHLGPVFVTERRHLDLVHRDLHRFPGAISQSLQRVVSETLDRLPRRSPADETVDPVPVEPGSLGSWHPEDEAAG